MHPRFAHTLTYPPFALMLESPYVVSADPAAAAAEHSSTQYWIFCASVLALHGGERWSARS